MHKKLVVLEKEVWLRKWCLLFLMLLPIYGFSASSNIVPLAPGYGDLAYDLPSIGSYRLPPLMTAADGIVLDDEGKKKSLHEIYQGKYTLLSFIYSHCGDINGCPLSSHVFNQLKSKMREDSVLAEKLQLLSISFDPKRDTPQAMKKYGENFRFSGSKGTWNFLTTSSVETLKPILEDYNQDIQRAKSISGEETGDISHILRIFLIDPELRIRNIYSVGFLHADLVLNDFKTLLLLEDNDKQNNQKKNEYNSALLSTPGDVKEGYEHSSYITSSKAVTERKGKVADLFSIAMNPPLGLPKIAFPEDNKLSEAKIKLGRKLFFDRRLSLNNTVSCAMCHIPEQGFASNELSMAVGFEGRSVRRNTPTIYNVAYASRLFHDGRDNSLEEQVWGPLLARNEMANPSVGYVLGKIRKLTDYDDLFEKAFNNKPLNIENLGKALASYQRTLISANSRFDQWFYNKKSTALSDSAKRGFSLFSGKANCIRCHTIDNTTAFFSDYKMHNTGIGYQDSMGIKPKKKKIILAPGIFIEVDNKTIDSVGETAPSDLGYYEITQNPQDRWKYKTPSLRNINLTAPYMHNGSIGTLEDVVMFYNKGGVKNPLLDTRIKPLNLSDKEIKDLVLFLKSLTGSNVDTLVADAFAAPVGDVLNIKNMDQLH